MAGFISAQNIEVKLKFRGMPEIIPVTGFSDDSDAIMFPQDDEYASVVTGADGEILVIRQGNRGGEVTIKLLVTSETTRKLMGLVSGQLGSDPKVLRVEYMTFDDSPNNILHTCNDGYLVKFPRGVTIGAGAVSPMMFTFFFETIIPDWSGTSNS